MRTDSLPHRLAFVFVAIAAIASGCGEPTKPDATPAEVSLTAVDTLRSLGETATLAATIKNASHQTLTGVSVSFQSSDPSVASVNSTTGVVTAVSNGSTFVRALAGVVADSARVTVRQRVDLAKSTLTVARPMLFIDDTVRVTLQARDALDKPIAFGGATVTFSSSGSGSSTLTLLPTVDQGGGAYTSDVIGTGIGTNRSITATIDDAAVAASASLRVVGFTKIVVQGFTISAAGGTTTGGHSCGIITTGEMYCWGMAAFGIRGNGSPGTQNPDPIPTLVGGNQQWTDVASGLAFLCALGIGGAAYCWGDGDVGQIGNGQSGNPPDVRTPTAVLGTNSFASISIGVGDGVCAVTVSSAAMCWGLGSYGRLGNGSEALSAVPVAVSGGLSFAAIATSFAGTCGIASAGNAYCWGHDFVLGGGGAPAPDTCASSQPCARTPVAVVGGHVFRPIIARDANVACAVSTDDKTYCWGTGYLGNGTQSLTNVPVAVSGGLTFTTLTAGDAGFCGAVAGGAAYCWGDNRSGRLGNNSTTAALEPVAVTGGHAFTQLSMSQDHACGISTDGNAWCWGGNDKGELGTRSVTPSMVPVRVKLFAP